MRMPWALKGGFFLFCLAAVGWLVPSPSLFTLAKACSRLSVSGPNGDILGLPRAHGVRISNFALIAQWWSEREE